jgi:hypothetical protein
VGMGNITHLQLAQFQNMQQSVNQFGNHSIPSGTAPDPVGTSQEQAVIENPFNSTGDASDQAESTEGIQASSNQNVEVIDLTSPERAQPSDNQATGVEQESFHPQQPTIPTSQFGNPQPQTSSQLPISTNLDDPFVLNTQVSSAPISTAHLRKDNTFGTNYQLTLPEEPNSNNSQTLSPLKFHKKSILATHRPSISSEIRQPDQSPTLQKDSLTRTVQKRKRAETTGDEYSGGAKRRPFVPINIDFSSPTQPEDDDQLEDQDNEDNSRPSEEETEIWEPDSSD